MNKKLYFIICMTLVTAGLFAQDRTPFYVHGFGDDQSAWSHWQSLFNSERRIATGNNTHYTSSQGVATMANAASGILSTIPYNNSIYFGHSMGGVIGMHIDVNNTNSAASHIGGYITAGAPLDGARIVNSVQDGSLANFTAGSLDKVLKGPIRQFGPGTGELYQVSGEYMKDLAETFINVAIALFVPQAQSQSANDLAEGSAYMTSGVRGVSTGTPKVLVYGNENSPVLFRIISTAASKPDNTFVNVANQAAAVYEGFKIANIGALNPYNLWLADGWADGQSWFESGGENGWNSLIGASTPSYYTYEDTSFDYYLYWNCMSGVDPGVPQIPDEDPADYCMRAAQIRTIYYVYSPVNGLSDGFIKAPSQTGFFTTWSTGAAKVEALGVNHLEMRDHPEMLNIYNNIFDGNIPGVSPFFSTLRR